MHDPAIAALFMSLLGSLRSAFRTRAELALENLALRQQLANLRHTSGRPRIRIDLNNATVVDPSVGSAAPDKAEVRTASLSDLQMAGIRKILVGIAFIIAGLSGTMVIRFTHSSEGLAILGVGLLFWGIFQVVKGRG
jgi:hypothetical protein